MHVHPLTLTVNSRLARWLLLEHDEQKQKAGEKAWQTPQILSLSSWLRNVWQDSWPDKYLLSPLQSEKIWEKIISKDADRLDLLHLKGIAAQTSKAYSLIHEYRLPRNPKLYESTDEAKIFLQWTRSYERQLAALGAKDPSTLMDAVKISMQNGEIQIPSSIRLMGFEEQNPQLEIFLQFLQQNETQIEFLSPVPSPSILEEKLNTDPSYVKVREFENRQDEVKVCARWIRHIYKPGKRIGIVVPELEKYRALLKRELAAELVPESIFNLDDQELPFNISLAPPLSQEPMIKLAMDLLNIKTSTIPINAFLSFIHSPFLGFEFPPSNEISNLERKLRKKRILSIPLAQFDSIFSSTPKVKQLAESLKAWAENNKNLMPEIWAEELLLVLKANNWPGKSSSTINIQATLSKRFQAFEAWKDCLNQFCSLNQILGPIKRLDAMNHLAHIVRGKQFQTKSPEHAIQIIGLLESSGMEFDHLWVMGCQSETLPSHPEPNPFIPYEIRNKYSIPRSNPKRELKFAEQSLSRLLMASNDVHFSYPRHEGNLDLDMSPLLKQFSKYQEDSTSSNRIKDQVGILNQLEEFEELTFLPVTSAEKNQFKTKGVSSGYGLIKNQVDCPFRAFARNRLNIDSIPVPETDFDNMDRGNIIHKALELFWSQTNNQHNLLNLSRQNEILNQQVEKFVREALELCSKRTKGQNQFNKLEIERNVKVILNWLLTVELKRSDFTVLNNEEEISINLSGLKLVLRIDRIDEIPGNGLLLIDYKTGREAKPAEWFADQIIAPQLPLYTVAKPPAGLAYGHLAIGKSKLKGTTTPGFPLDGFNNSNYPKEYKTWEELLEHWKISLNDVADDFIKGNNQVLPVNNGKPCRYCEFGSLCRIQEIGQLEIEEDVS